MSIQDAAARRLQTGSAAGDSNYQTAAQRSKRLQDIRSNRGLEADSASNQIWLDRIAAGTHSLGDARTAISNKAGSRTIASTPPMTQETPSTPESIGQNRAGGSGSSNSNQGPPTNNFGETPEGVGINRAGSSQPADVSSPYQTGDVPGDASFTSPDQILGRLADIRSGRGLSADPESDAIWLQRINSGQATIGDARTAITGKAMKQSEPSPVGEEVIPPSDVSFDFNPEYAAGMNQAGQMEANLRSQEELQNRRMAEDSQFAQQNANEFRDDSLEANTESMADRGLVYSGINIGQQAEIGEDYVKVSNEINKARARGEEDLARFLATQYNQIENYKTQLENARAREQEQAERDRALYEAINETPQPTAAGRYDLSYIRANDSARSQNTGEDLNALESGQTLAERVEAIFNNRNVPIASREETDAVRIKRIVEDVASGDRNLDDIRNSVDLIARNMNL